MKRKLNMPILGLFAALGEITSAAAGKIIPWEFTAREYANRRKQTPANPAKKARRRMVQASQHRNRM